MNQNCTYIVTVYRTYFTIIAQHFCIIARGCYELEAIDFGSLTIGKHPISMKVATKTRNNRRTTCPEGWVPAGAKAPLRLTKKQEQYCRRAIGINRFCYNLAVATHRFCRNNRLSWPSWQDIYKEFNACKRQDYPIATEAASRVAEGAFMDFGKALANWRNRSIKARAPKFRKR